MHSRKICEWHLCNNELPFKRRKYCSDSCKVKSHVSTLRRRLKKQAVDYKGGKCERCGYDRCIAALEFHHCDPSNKSFGISGGGKTRPWKQIQTELDKCEMVCANCHREIESGIL